MHLSQAQKDQIAIEVQQAEEALAESIDFDNTPASEVNKILDAQRIIFVIDWLLHNTNLTLNP